MRRFVVLKFVKRRFVICAMSLAISAGVIAVPRSVRPQTDSGATIRTTTDEVLVPVFVSDEKSVEELDRLKPEEVARLLAARDFRIWAQLSVNDLTIEDFHLFHDRQEQKILSARLEPTLFSEVRDNAGQHGEFVTPGAGKWSYPDEPDPRNHFVFTEPHYLIGYSPPPSPSGSCHRIEVKVDRPGSSVTSRDEYCNTKFSADDLLSGTEIGKDIEAELPRAAKGKIHFSAKAFAFSVRNSGRVHVVLEMPPRSEVALARDNVKEPTIGMLLVAYAKDGSIAARRGDLETFVARGNAPAPVPIRYETDVQLGPGMYRVQAFLSDGINFGEAEASVTVPVNDGTHLALSDIALARRYRYAKAESENPEATSIGRYAALVGNGIQITPTAEPVFEKGEPFHYYFEVYEPRSGADISVAVHIRIVDAKTGELRKDMPSESLAPFMAAGDPVIRVEGQDEIGDLKKGAYRLEVQATDAEGKSTDWHTATFTVQ